MNFVNRTSRFRAAIERAAHELLRTAHVLLSLLLILLILLMLLGHVTCNHKSVEFKSLPKKYFHDPKSERD